MLVFVIFKKKYAGINDFLETYPGPLDLLTPNNTSKRLTIINTKMNKVFITSLLTCFFHFREVIPSETFGAFM